MNTFPAYATRYSASPEGEWTRSGSFPIRINGSVAYVPLGTEVAQSDRIAVDSKTYDVLGVLATRGLSAQRIAIRQLTHVEGFTMNSTERTGAIVEALVDGGIDPAIIWHETPKPQEGSPS